MTDLGLHNFIKINLGKGKTKEEIFALLEKSKYSREDIENAFLEIDNDVQPITNDIQSEKYIKEEVVVSESKNSSFSKYFIMFLLVLAITFGMYKIYFDNPVPNVSSVQGDLKKYLSNCGRKDMNTIEFSIKAMKIGKYERKLGYPVYVNYIHICQNKDASYTVNHKNEDNIKKKLISAYLIKENDKWIVYNPFENEINKFYDNANKQLNEMLQKVK